MKEFQKRFEQFVDMYYAAFYTIEELRDDISHIVFNDISDGYTKFDYARLENYWDSINKIFYALLPIKSQCIGIFDSKPRYKINNLVSILSKKDEEEICTYNETMPLHLLRQLYKQDE